MIVDKYPLNHLKNNYKKARVFQRYQKVVIPDYSYLIFIQFS